MEKLVERCRRLIALTQTEHVRSIMTRINWDVRLCAIRGAKGVGKTTLMLQYLKLHGCDFQQSLYVSLDSTYFTQHTLEEFVDVFYKHGGKHLFIDEVHKYPGWSQEIKNIYDEYPDLRVVFSGSSLLNILDGDADLSRRCIPYTMQGMSYREYLELVHGIKLPLCPLEQLLTQPNILTEEVNKACRPLAYFDDYLHVGYYPYLLEGRDEYFLRMENVVNFILEVELPQLCGVDVANVRKLKSFLAIAATGVPMQVDMTKLSAAAEMSRTTLLGYLQHLNRAKLLNLIYSGDTSVKKLQKPDKIYLENPNLIDILSLETPNAGTMREAFMVNQLCHQHKVDYSRQGDLVVDGTYTIEIGGKSKDGKQIANVGNAFIAADGIEYAYGNKIPLWAFGFLY